MVWKKQRVENAILTYQLNSLDKYSQKTQNHPLCSPQVSLWCAEQQHLGVQREPIAKPGDTYIAETAKHP